MHLTHQLKTCFMEYVLVKQYENKRNLNLFYQIKINNINHFEFLLSVSFFQTARFDETCSALTFNIGIALAVV